MRPLIFILVTLFPITNIVVAQTSYFNNRISFSSSYEGASNIFLFDSVAVLYSTVNTSSLDRIGTCGVNINYGNVSNKKVHTWDNNFYIIPGAGGMVQIDGKSIVGASTVWIDGVYPQVFFQKYDYASDSLSIKLITTDTNYYKGATSIKKCRENGYIIAGFTDSLDPGLANGMAIRIDSLGNRLWTKSIGNNTHQEPFYAVDTTLDGGFILAGYKILNPWTMWAYVVNVDSLGTIKWQRTYSNIGANNILTLRNGGYLITSGYADSILGSGYYFSKTNLIRIDNNGNVLWSKKYKNATAEHEAKNTIQLSNGDFVTCGSIGHYNDPPVGGTSWGMYGFILKTDSSGNEIFHQTYEATTYQGAFNYLMDIKQTPDGGFIATGFIQGDGSQDIWVLKIDSMGCETSNCILTSDENIPESKPASLSMSCYPNPFNSEITINYSLSTGETGILKIYEAGSGKEIFNKHLNSNEGTLVISDLNISAGIYFCTIITNKGKTLNQKLVKLD